MSRNTKPSLEEIEANENLEDQRKFRRMVEFLNTPSGSLLLRPGYTINRWTNSNPTNVWINNKAGDVMVHSVDGFDCPIRSAVALLRPYLVVVDDCGQHVSWGISPELIALHAQHMLDRKSAPAQAPSVPRARM